MSRVVAVGVHHRPSRSHPRPDRGHRPQEEQADLLDRFIAADLLTVTDLTDAGALPVPADAGKPLPKAITSSTGRCPWALPD